MFKYRTIPLYDIHNWPQNKNYQIQQLSHHPEKFNSILIYMFDDCNMKCDFCVTNAEHKQKIYYNPNLFASYLDDVKKCIPLMRNDGKYGISLIGGELFLPKININIYDKFLYELTQIISKNSQIQIISNFLFDNPSEIYDLIKKYNIKIDMSFDLVGRYKSINQLNKAKTNLYKLLDLGLSHINIIMTNNRFNIKSILEKGLNFDSFLELYNNPRIQIQLSEYIDMSQWLNHKDIWAPTVDEEIFFFKHLIDFYPKIKDVQQLKVNLKDGKINEYRCGEIYISHNKIGYCTDDYLARRNQYMSNNQCFTCKYFKCCSLVCYKGCVDFNICWKRSAYDYLINKGFTFNE